MAYLMMCNLSPWAAPLSSLGIHPPTISLRSRSRSRPDSTSDLPPLTRQVHVHRRLVTVGHMERLQLGLDEAYGLQPHNKLAEAFGNVVSAIQVRAAASVRGGDGRPRTGEDDV